MPLYFFNLRTEVSEDDLEGEELADADAARERAVCYAAEMAAASLLETRRLDLNHYIDVADQAGATVLRLRYGEALQIEA